MYKFLHNVLWCHPFCEVHQFLLQKNNHTAWCCHSHGTIVHILPSHVKMANTSKQFHCSFIGPEDIAPEMKIFVPVCICKLPFYVTFEVQIVSNLRISVNMLGVVTDGPSRDVGWVEGLSLSWVLGQMCSLSHPLLNILVEKCFIHRSAHTVCGFRCLQMHTLLHTLLISAVHPSVIVIFAYCHLPKIIIDHYFRKLSIYFLLWFFFSLSAGVEADGLFPCILILLYLLYSYLLSCHSPSLLLFPFSSYI